MATYLRDKVHSNSSCTILHHFSSISLVEKQSITDHIQSWIRLATTNLSFAYSIVASCCPRLSSCRRLERGGASDGRCDIAVNEGASLNATNNCIYM